MIDTNHSCQSVTTIDTSLLDELVESARTNPRLRCHFNLHTELQEPFQRMIVAMHRESYIRPHRHWLTPKPETLLCLRGAMGVIIFDDEGTVRQRISLSPNGDTMGCDIPPGAWHCIVSLSGDAVFMEAKPGPYTPFEPEDFAAWAPEPDAETCASFLKDLQQGF